MSAIRCLIVSLIVVVAPLLATSAFAQEDTRMDWWREARFGLFIHWGLYAVPAGEWNGQTHHGEWIMNSARIPVETYEKFLAEFNPVKFDADRWVRTARDAGMRYIVITSKHHDGFALFDSKVSDYDVMATPFRRDILKELAGACERHGVRLCFYHSIMDWHHPDYLPRRSWEKRSAEGADYDRFVKYVKAQVEELLTGYGNIGVMWFDGEWESTWNHEYGRDLYAFCRRLRPDLIVNNRVDKGRGGMAGLTAPGFCGDFGTPEQEIPDRGLPGVDWETCMTMNRHWGYNKHDDRWKSTEDLIRKLCDIASKGGNFLLNVGPTGEGEFPAPCVERLEAMGAWMKVNGEAIHGTTASPFGLFEWGRCTAKAARHGGPSRLFLHVFERPEGGTLRLSGLTVVPKSARLIAAPDSALACRREPPFVVIELPEKLPDPIATVVELVFERPPEVIPAPAFAPAGEAFVDSVTLTVSPRPRSGLTVRYTLDGTAPTAESPALGEGLRLDRGATVTAQVFAGKEPVSEASRRTLRKVEPRVPVAVAHHEPGWRVEAYEGEWNRLPDFSKLTPVRTGRADRVGLTPAPRKEYVGLRFTGFVRVPESGVYRFGLRSDDGSALHVGEVRVVDNDGLHGAAEKSGEIALAAGLHPVEVTWFNKTGGRHLAAWIEGPGLVRQPLAADVVVRTALTVIPAPARVVMGTGVFRLTPETRIVAGPGAEAIAERLAAALRPATGFALAVAAAPLPAGSEPRIVLNRLPAGATPPEGYRLAVAADCVTAGASTEAGLFYATVTLRQLLPPLIESHDCVEGAKWIAPACVIEDAPRFGWRGLMIDSCRHYQPKAWILRLLDWMACHKLNRFHWHLTEDEAWRLEIRKYPELTRVGAWRTDGAYRHGGYYTQDDVREVVAYAQRLHITVVPEIEMPGHSMAALVAKPELSCAGTPIPVGRGGLRHFTAHVRRLPFCAGREKTFRFLEDVLDEVLALFPSPWIHIGGDERPRGAWKACARCQERIRRENLGNEDGLQSWFVRRIDRFLTERGRRLVGWDEILEGGLAPNATVMSWRGVSGGIAAARAGHDVVMSPTSHCYFDYWQGDPAVEPVGRGHCITPEVVLGFEPVPDALAAEEARHILGAQANVWTEYLTTPELVEYMAFPRVCALAEVVWTPRAPRDWKTFEPRLGRHLARLAALGIRFRVPPPEGLEAEIRFEDRAEVVLRSPVPGGVVRWVRGRRTPHPDSPPYEKPIVIRDDTVIAARVFLPDGRASACVVGVFRKEKR